VALNDLLGALARPPEVLRQLAGVPGLRLVGGWLRQAYRGSSSLDLDLTCEQPLDETVAAVAALLDAEPFALNERYPTRRLLAGEYTLDISQLTDTSVTADIARRDYTCNTLMVRLDRLGPDVVVTDLEGHPEALDHLVAGTLQMVSADSLRDDPLRLLRGYRLCATEGFTPEVGTRGAWRELSSLARRAAPERIHEELLRWFSTEGRLSSTVAMCAEDGVLWEVFPTLRSEVDCVQSEDVIVWEHTLECLSHLDELRANLPPELQPHAESLAAAWTEPVSGVATAGTLARLALLLHDAAKPATRAVDEEGKLSFYDHQNVGAELLLPELQSLKFAGVETDYILLLIREHLRLGFYSDALTPRLIYRYIRRLGRATPLMLLHSIADCMATHGDWVARALPEHITAAAQILSHYYAADSVASPPLLLDGNEIMALLKIRPGRIVGKIKDALLEATASGEVVIRSEAVAFVRKEYKARTAIQ